MSGRNWLVGLTFAANLVALPAAAQPTPVFKCEFQDELPFSCTWTASGGGSSDLIESTRVGPASCAPGVAWNRERVASGGWNSRGYLRQTYCDAPTSGLSGTLPTGFGWGPPRAIDDTWPATFYLRFRIYFEGPIVADRRGDIMGTIKWLLWHQGVYDGDQRIIMSFGRGDTCGAKAAAAVCLSVARNINEGSALNPGAGSDVARAPIAVGEWAHVQVSWRHGVEGTSFLKVWVNNNTEKSPTAQDTALTAVPRVPGGTSEWVRDEKGYNGELQLGNMANNGTSLKEPFVYRLMDFEVGDAFDASWNPAPIGKKP